MFTCPHPDCTIEYDVDTTSVGERTVLSEGCEGCGGRVFIDPDSPLTVGDKTSIAIHTEAMVGGVVSLYGSVYHI